MENFYSHLKEEALRKIKTPSFEEARQVVDEYIPYSVKTTSGRNRG
jgi:Integrase core domain